MQAFGRNRNAPTPPELTTHPLLLDNSLPGSRAPANTTRNARQPQRMFMSGDVIQNVEELMAGGNLQIVRHIANRNRTAGGTETFRFDVSAGMILNLERNLLQHRRTPGAFTTSIRLERPQRAVGPKQNRELDPLFTLQRWQEEVKILNGEFVLERVTKLVNHAILALLPAAVDAARKTKIREEQERQEKARLEQAKEEEGKQPDEPLPSQDETPTAPDTQTNQPQVTPASTETSDASAADTDTVMLDATAEAAAEEGRDDQQGTVVENDTDIQASSSQAAPAERITVLIHGSAVDITDTGIDPTFLEALPDDMREEVLNQHVRDQQAARVERPPDSQISAEFLDALPPEIRAEILQQEAFERARRREADTRTEPSGVPAEIDAASFIASLEPHLRQAVLLEQDDGFIQTLPSHMIAEAGSYRENQPYRGQYGSQPQRPQHPTARKVAPQHDAVQLLDKSGVSVLVRLLFFPQISKKTLLFKILLNLCENSKTRTELFNHLLTILQDGTVEHIADKSLTQPQSKVAKPQTPKSAAKHRSNSDHVSGLSLSSQAEMMPDLIAQRCLEALTYIVSSNELSSLFFLTDHDLPVGLRKAVTRKGKGKEKQMPQTYYPIVFLLLLLEKQYLLRTPAIMESIVSLLATVTRPLASLKEERKDPSNDAPETTEPTVEPSVPTGPSTSADSAPPVQAGIATDANATGSCK
jgi:E3 ubiquitin-protein ligase HUWE1